MQGLHLGTTAGRRFLAAIMMFVLVPCSPHPHGAPRFRYMQSRTRVHRTLHVTTFGCHLYPSMIYVR